MYDFSNYKPSPEEVKKNAEKQERLKNERLERQRKEKKEREEQRLVEEKEQSEILSQLYGSISATMMSTPENLKDVALPLAFNERE